MQIIIISMQNLRRIRKMNEEQAEKKLALTQLSTRKSSSNSGKSFINPTSKKQLEESSAKREENPIFLIKDLDSNKVQVIDRDDKVQKIIQDLSQLPEIERLLETIWQKYASKKEQEEERFLEACYQGDVALVQKVIASKSEHPIDPRSALTDEGKNGIHLATVSGSYRNVEIIATLVNYKVDINGRTCNEQRTPLMLGSILGNEVAVKSLLELGADHSLQDYEGNTALHLACGYNQDKVVDILLEFKASTQIKNNKDQTPIECVSSQQLYEMAKLSEHKGYNQRSVVFMNEMPVVYRNSRKDDVDKLLKKIRQSYETATRSQQNQEENSQQQPKSLVKPKTRKQLRQDKIKQVMIRQIKEIGLSSFKKISILGKGAFGEVYLVQNTQDGERYAMKVLDKGMIMRQNILRYCMTERKILSTINHPFVVRLHYAFQSTEKLFLVMQYCPGGDVLKLIKKKGKLDEDLTRKYVAEIVLAIEELHKAEIIYRDLKPGNVVLDAEGHACLTDFGLSKEASLSHSFCGSTAYLAPEMLWRRGHTKVLDWYLLGVFIYECLTGRPPFWDTNRQQLMSNIKSGRYKHLPNEFSKQVKDLIENLLKSNSTKRLGAHGPKQIKAHAWFAGVDWKAVENKEQKMQEVDFNQGKPIREENFEEPEFVQNKVKGWDFNKESQETSL